MSERLPDFLIIGAMKSGTTTLYRDLLTHSRIYFPLNKEPGDLETDAVLTPGGRAAYAKHFERARNDQLCGDASTSYAKLPDIPGVPQRAVKLLPTGFKVIYLVREPVSRTISQHYHEYTGRLMGADIDHALTEHPRLIDFSRYAMQIEPWIEAVGHDRVRIVLFEEYTRDRRGKITELCTFLGLPPEAERVEAEKVFNRGEGKAIPAGFWARVMTAPWYRRLVRPLLPIAARDRFRQALLPKAPPRPAPPSRASVQAMVEVFQTDELRLRAMLERETPLWDWRGVLARYGAVNDDGGRNTAYPLADSTS